MDGSGIQHTGKQILRITVLKILILYVLVPVSLLILLAAPVSEAVRRSDANAFLIILAAAGAVGMNWLVYSLLHRKHPPVPVFAHGILCLTVVVFIEHFALPGYHALAPVLAYIGGFLALMDMLMLSFWLAARRSRPAHVFAVGLRITVGVILFLMAWQILREIESRQVTRDTWITAGILVVTILVRNSPRIVSAVRRTAFHRRASGLTAGKIVQILGETHLDLDDDPVTLSHARVQYSVDGILYETRADISRYTIRKFGKPAIVGKEIPVCYNPANPSEAYVNRIDRHFFEDNPVQHSGEEQE